MIVRLRGANATGPDDPFQRDPKPDSLPHRTPFPVLAPLPDDAVFQDIVYAGDHVYTFDMNGDMATRVGVVARQVYGLHGTRGLEMLAEAFVGDPEKRWELRGEGHARPTEEGGVTTWSREENAWVHDPDATSVTSYRRRLLDALTPAKLDIEAIAKRTRTWIENNARGFAIHKLFANAAQVNRERVRYSQGQRAGAELLDLAIQWKRIVKAVAEVVDARTDRAMLEYLSAQNATTLAALIVHLMREREKDATLQTGIALQRQAELKLHQTVASAGMKHPVLFKLWQRGDIAGRVLAALDAPTDAERIAALSRSTELERAIADVLDTTAEKITRAVTIMRASGAQRAWEFEPLIKRVRVAGRIIEGTVEHRAIAERLANAPTHWLSRVSSAAGLLAFAGMPLAGAVALIAGVIEIAIAALAAWDTDDIAQAALSPMDSIAAEPSVAGLIVVLCLHTAFAKLLPRLVQWLGAVIDVHTLSS